MKNTEKIVLSIVMLTYTIAIQKGLCGQEDLNFERQISALEDLSVGDWQDIVDMCYNIFDEKRRITQLVAAFQTASRNTQAIHHSSNEISDNASPESEPEQKLIGCVKIWRDRFAKLYDYPYTPPFNSIILDCSIGTLYTDSIAVKKYNIQIFDDGSIRRVHDRVWIRVPTTENGKPLQSGRSYNGTVMIDEITWKSKDGIIHRSGKADQTVH